MARVVSRIVIAPDKFKGTLTAAEVAGHLAEGMPGVDVVIMPVADGGDGTLDAFVGAGFERRCGGYARRGRDAVVELAAIAGLASLGARRAPMTASSSAVGAAIGAAIDAGCTRIVLGIGGSASTDGGAGMLAALGARVCDGAGAPIGPGGVGLSTVDTVDFSVVYQRMRDVELLVACDVDNPLTGSNGAAEVYGPQKGASAEQVRELDAALLRWADVVAASTGVDHRDAPGAGAAGGVGFAAIAVLGGRLRPGVELVLDLLGFADALAGADLVITGEGSLDEQTLRGKAPAGVAAVARDAGVPVIAVAGRCTLDAMTCHNAGFDAVYTLADDAGSVEEAMANPAPSLRRIGARIASESPR